MLFLGLFSSCEKQVPYDFNDFEQKIVVDCIVDNGMCKIYLSKNLSTLAPDTILSVDGAKITINNILLTEQSNMYKHIFSDLTEGDELELTITKNQYPQAYAKDLVPSTPKFNISGAKIISNSKRIVPFAFNDIYQIDILIDDVKKKSQDIYIIELIKTRMAMDVNYNPDTGLWEDKLIKYIWPEVFYIEDNAANIADVGYLDFRLNKTEFTLDDDLITPYAWIIPDKTFDGQNKVVSLYCRQDDFYQNIEIKVSTINSGYYEFIQSVAAYHFNNPMFNEPVHIKSNINNGLGYFGIKVTTTDSIKINTIK